MTSILRVITQEDAENNRHKIQKAGAYTTLFSASCESVEARQKGIIHYNLNNH